MASGVFLKLYPDNPNPSRLERVAEVLRKGGLVIYPTDTVYGLGCDITKARSVERIIRIKGLKPKDAQFSFICNEISQVSQFARVDNAVFKLMKKNLPGPFTFILPGLNRVPDYFLSRRKTVGVRIPSNPIPTELVRLLGNPILTTSVKDDDQLVEYTTAPELIYEKYKSMVDMVIDGGFSDNLPSTVVDCTDASNFQIIRQGKGELIK